MKTLLVSLLLNCLLLPRLLAQTSPSAPRLTGIVNLSDQKSVLLDAGPARSAERFLILRESERAGEIEVLRINTNSGNVELRIGRTNCLLTMRRPGEDHPTPNVSGSLTLADADIDPVLRLYAGFKGRTLLRSPRLPAASFSLESAVTNQAGAALVLEKALAAKGITTIPDGDKFVLVVPVSEAAAVKPRSADSRSSAGNGGRPEFVPAGAMYFANADVNQLAQFYAQLIGLNLEQIQHFPRPTVAISINNQTPLSKEECIYALDTLFRWQGVKVVPVGQGLAKIILIPNAEQ